MEATGVIPPESPHHIDHVRRLITKLGKTLLDSGIPCPNVEAMLETLARRLGCRADIMSTPTSMMFTLVQGEETRTRVVRINPGGADFSRLSEVFRLVKDVDEGRMTPLEAELAMERVLAHPPLYGNAWQVLSMALLSAGFGCLVQLSWFELGFATVLGGVLGLMLVAAQGRALTSYAMPMLGAASMAFAIFFAAQTGYAVRPLPMLIATLLWFFPGMTMTIAMVELASGHWVSGSSRMIAGATTLFLLIFGVAIGMRLASLALSAPVVFSELSVEVVPPWAYYAGVLALGISIVITFSGKREHFLWIMVGCLIALIGGKLGALAFGPAMGPFLGALLATLCSGVLERISFGPAYFVMLWPAYFLMVPGSMGFRSLASLLNENLDTSIAQAFDMVMIMVSIAMGVMLGSAGSRRLGDAVARLLGR
ncbi:MAG: threonine/serine exporter family protein [Gammaproteobacteria bacterium]|nr:threonine/serine exporter family protein [Gammaproteobacteria bacterium]